MQKSGMKSRPGGLITVLASSIEQKVSSGIECILGSDITINYSALEDFHFQRLTSTQFDFVLLTGIVAYVDRKIRRQPSKGWQRDLSISVPVHDPEVWNRPIVKNSLSDCLSFLTGDSWVFEFVRRPSPDPWLQNQQFLNIRAFEPVSILPFSGGMDSWAITRMLQFENPSENFLLVQIKNSSAIALFANDNKAGGSSSRIQTISLPFRLRSRAANEPSYRARSFVFFGAAALASILSGCNHVTVTENGQGSIGPSLLPFAHEWPLRGAHPGFTFRLRRFLQALLSVDVNFDHRSLWSTKGEILQRVATNVDPQTWPRTYSCTRPRRTLPISSPRLDCGICGNCLLTRVSLNTAGVRLSGQRYIWDNLSAKELDDALDRDAKRKTSNLDTRYAVHAIKDQVLLAALTCELDDWSRIAAEELSPALNVSYLDTQTKVRALVAHHSNEWKAFLDLLPTNSWFSAVAECWRD